MATQINLKFNTNMDRSSLTPTRNITVKGAYWDDYTESYNFDGQDAEDIPVQIQLVGESLTDFLAVFSTDLPTDRQYRFYFSDSVEDSLNIPIVPFFKYFGRGATQ